MIVAEAVVYALHRKRQAANRATHKPRFSDSSLYDEVCTVCGARDWTPGEDELSARLCSPNDAGAKHD